MDLWKAVGVAAGFYVVMAVLMYAAYLVLKYV
jgi:hypothetical protein